MTTTKRTAPDTAGEESSFYIIFDELAKAEQDDAASIQMSDEELDEIEQVRRMVVDTTDESPVFMTST